MAASRRNAAGGFTLIEVLIATALLVAVSVGVAHLFAISTMSAAAARDQTSTGLLAAARLEQLNSLAWSYTPTESGWIPYSDVSTNLSLDVPDDSGPGLSPSPPGTLATSIPPYVDYLDANGRWLGNGSSPPPAATFVRRWSVVPLLQDPQRTLILTVRVTTMAFEARRGTAMWRGRVGSETVLIALKTRRGA